MRKVLFILVLFAAFTMEAQPKQSKTQTKAKTYDVAAYLYPAYAAGEPRLKPFWPKTPQPM